MSEDISVYFTQIPLPQQYCSEILLVLVLLFWDAVSSGIRNIKDNGLEMSSITELKIDIEHVKWLTYSPNFKPFENVWKTLDRRVSQRKHPSLTSKGL
ncbi:hypothetical protein TNIN_237591 [Trichonephila inaurata madagascariensis]|uniref:Uncharacterized protein n=1 Tax=Trichonephila inaurata madagascariensis TaxID=2747483 RepID=A0A8X6X8C8_9ARAC|nr:hypothetical protein TNIN_237591 [Trichonephila inaurata madagascariensis]